MIWRIVDCLGGMERIGLRAIVDEDGETICNPSPMGDEQARLIISAPIMFRALDALLAAADTSLDYRPEFRLAVANANAAMALATGRNMPLTQDITESEVGHHD